MSKLLDVLRLKDLPCLVEQLADQINKSGFDPEHILYIERSGRLIGYLLQQEFYQDIPISGIYAARSGSRIKEMISPVFRMLPEVVSHFIRKFEWSSGIHRKRKERNIYSEDIVPAPNTKVLIVDDALDTGNSMLAVINYLSSLGINRDDIRSAVLTTTHETNVIDADYTCYRHHWFAYPWSPDSREAKQFHHLYNTCLINPKCITALR